MRLINQVRSRRNSLLALTAAVIFLVVQAADLQHTHDGRLDLQSDCHICLKLGSNGKVALAAAELPTFQTQSHAYLEFTSEAIFLPGLPARSRSPPVVTA